MTLNKLVDFDQPLPNFEKRIKERVDKDLRMISFSTYGIEKNPAFPLSGTSDRKICIP